VTEDPWQTAPTNQGDQSRLIRKKSWQALLLGLLGIALIGAVVPYGAIAGLACAAAALVLGIRTRRMAKSAKLPTGRATLSIVSGGVGLALGLIVSITLAVFWNEFRTYQTCQSDALTIQTKNQCYNDLVDSLEHRLGVRL
jgi:FtsH-binding integral membrane protein